MPQPHLYDGQSHLGYAIELEDVVSLDAMTMPFAFASKASDDLPDEVDPAKWGLVIEDQGPMGSCQGHDISTCCENLLFWEHGLGPKDVQLSRYFAYRATQEIDGITGDRGSTINGGIKLCKSTGLCLESLCPYPNPVRYGSFKKTKEMLEDAATRKLIGAVVDIKASPNPFQAAVEWIGAYGSITMGIRWPVQLNAQSVVVATNNGTGGGHALATCGYRKLNDNTRVLITDNSHATRFGDKGRMYWTEKLWNAMCKRSDSTVRGITSLTSPKRKLRAWTPSMKSPV